MAQTYAKYNLPQLWQIVAGEDADAGIDHVAALNRLQVALDQQIRTLRGQRDRMAEGWPPERSEAAAAFVGQLNAMIDDMNYLVGAAGRIATGVSETYSAIFEAKQQMERLKSNYPGHADGSSPQVTDPNLDQLGRELMMATDGRVADAAKSYSAPLPPYRNVYDPSLQAIDEDPRSDRSGDGGGSAGGGSRSVALRPPVFDPPPPASEIGGGDGRADPPGSDDPGPVLSGGPTNPAALPPGGASGEFPSSPGTPDYLGSPGRSPIGVIGGVGPGRMAPVSDAVGAHRPGVVGPDGVIGGRGRPGGAVPGQMMGGPTAGSASRAGGPRAGRGRPAGGRSGSSSEPGASREMSGAAGGYRDQSYETCAERRRLKRGEDDELWSVEEGVPPLLEAAPEQKRHDPGPGVLGIDR